MFGSHLGARPTLAVVAAAALLVSACADSALSPAHQLPSVPRFSLQAEFQVAAGQALQLSTPQANYGLREGHMVNWQTLNAAVAKVSTTGLVTGVAAGTTKILVWVVATNVDTVPIKVLTPIAIGSITLSPTSTTLSPGQTIQPTAIVKNTSGTIVPGIVLTWTSTSPTIAKVDAAGLVTALVAGTTTIRAAANGKIGTMATTVSTAPPPGPGPVASVTVSLAPSSILVTQTATATATAKDASGVTVPGAPVVWSSTDGAVATVSGSGLVNGVSAGTASIRATVNGIVGSANVSVSPNVTGGSTIPAALPQATVPIGPTPVTGATIVVHAGDNLQAALNSAQRGDQIVIDAGATFTGNFILPAKSGTSANGWITIRTSNVAGLPPAGTRLQPATHGAALAKIVSPNVNAALATALSSSGWRLIGLEITTANSLCCIQYGIVTLGDGSSAQNLLSEVASDLIVDRSYIHAQPAVQTKRCIALNSARTAIIDSYISDCKGKGFDTQAIGGWNGPGPFLIQNNRLEGAGENIMFGGADPFIPNLIPSDITIRQNYIYKPKSWKTSNYTVKNIFELKNAQRILVEGNVLRNNWVGAQAGYAVVIGSVNQAGACTWCVAQDVTFRHNMLDSTAGGFNLFEGYAGAQWTRRVNISNNLITAVGVAGLGSNGRVFQVMGHFDDLAIENNTGFSPLIYLLFGDVLAILKNRFTFRNNIGGAATYNMHSAIALGGALLPLYCGTSYTFVGNVFVGAVPALPIGNSLATSIAALGFVNPTPNGNWSLSASSAFKTSGQGGTAPGVDWPTLSGLVANVDK
jgi:hypothetical protein